MQRGFVPLIILLVAFLLLAGILYFTFQFIRNYAPASLNTSSHLVTSSPTPTVASASSQLTLKPSPFPNSSPIPKGYSRITTYALSNNTITNLDQLYLGLAAALPRALPSGNFLVNDYKQVLLYDPFQKTQKQIYQNTDSGAIIQVKYDESNNILYLTKTTNTYPRTVWMDIVNRNNNTIRTINNIPTVTNGSLEYLMTVDDSDIIASFNGDICNGDIVNYGIIYQYKDTPTPLFQNGGVGCNQGPRYIGSIIQTGTLLFIIPNDQIMALDVRSRQQSNILDLKPYKDQVAFINYDNVSHMVYLIVGDELWTFNPLDKTLQKKIFLTGLSNLTPPKTNWQTLIGNRLYGRDDQAHIVIADSDKKSVSTLNIDFGPNLAPIFITRQSDQDIIATEESNP